MYMYVVSIKHSIALHRPLINVLRGSQLIITVFDQSVTPVCVIKTVCVISVYGKYVAYMYNTVNTDWTVTVLQ